MSEDVKKGLVPKLRFPEFLEAGVWEEKTLSSLLDYQQPTDYLVSNTNYSDSYKTPVLTAGKTFILGYTNEQHGIFSKNLPIIIFDDFTTATQFVNFSFKAKSSAMKILQAKNGVSIKFMYESLQMIAYEVGAHERHWISKFAPMVILAPNSMEQQKIADCLSSIDALIHLQTQKLDALKTHKKSLMQQLFPREGETVPRLRFGEFLEAGAWKIKKIGEISENITAGGTPSTTKKAYWGGSIRWMNSGELNHKKVYEVQGRITDDGLQNSSTKIIPEFCVLIGLAGQGKTRGTVAMNMVELCINQSIAAILPNNKFSSDFLYYNLDNRYDELRSLSAGGEGRGGLNLQIIKSIEVPLPTLPEQQKIASCLSSIDTLIHLQTQKLDALKTHKKSLMQQLFPSQQTPTHQEPTP